MWVLTTAVLAHFVRCPCYLLLGEEVLDQGAHDLLRGPGGADVGEEDVPVGLLGVADPA